MNTLFQINGSIPKRNDDILLCEWGENFCITTLYQPETKTLHELKYFTFELLTDGVANEILALPEFTTKDKIYICSAFPQAQLIPKKLYKENVDLLSPLYGLNYKEAHSDFIGEWQLYNNYALPASLHNRLQESFQNITFIHSYTTSLRAYNGVDAGNQVSVHFSPKNFSVIVKKNAQLLLAQIYFYSTHLDVIYYLLKIFQESGLDNNSSQIILSGLVDMDSTMYKEIFSYFSNVEFHTDSSILFENNPHPSHFFTSVSNLATCVSSADH